MRVLFLKTEIYLSYFFDPKRGHCSAPHYAPRLEHQERRQRCRRSVGLREWRQIIGACATDLGTASAVPFPVAKPGRPPYFFFWPCLSVLAASLSRVSRVRGFCRSLPARLSSSFDGGLFLAAISYLTSRNSVPKSLRSLMKRITRSVILDVGRGTADLTWGWQQWRRLTNLETSFPVAGRSSAHSSTEREMTLSKARSLLPAITGAITTGKVVLGSTSDRRDLVKTG
jgi:hypothetical protein